MFKRKPVVWPLHSVLPGVYHELTTGVEWLHRLPTVPKCLGRLGIVGVVCLEKDGKQTDILAFSISRAGQCEMEKYISSLEEKGIFVKHIFRQNFDGLFKEYLLFKIKVFFIRLKFKFF